MLCFEAPLEILEEAASEAEPTKFMEEFFAAGYTGWLSRKMGRQIHPPEGPPQPGHHRPLLPRRADEYRPAHGPPRAHPRSTLFLRRGLILSPTFPNSSSDSPVVPKGQFVTCCHTRSNGKPETISPPRSPRTQRFLGKMDPTKKLRALCDLGAENSPTPSLSSQRG